MLTSWTLFIAQIFAHIGFLILILTGSLFEWIVCLFMYFLMGCLGITMLYHRRLAHKSWEAPRLFEYVATFFATLGLTGSAITWVATHRKHHRYSDTPMDPHSPIYKGFIYCQWLSMFEKVELKYAADLRKNKLYYLQHRYYFLICCVYTTLLIFIDPFSVVYALLAPACILWNAASLIVTWSHLYGQKAHNIKSNARNNWILGLLVWGEGWHNNHHHNAGSPYFFEKAWQVDIGGYLIFIFVYISNKFHLLKRFLQE